MLLNSSYWKNELEELISDIQANLDLPKDENKDMDDVSYSEFRLERALIYSAFVIRLLYESGKLTESMKGFNLQVIKIPCILNDVNETYPLFRRAATYENYDFENGSTEKISGKAFTNQIIHSYTMLAFEKNEQNVVTGFFVTSDFDSDKCLYLIKMEDWIMFIEKVVSDSISFIDSWFDENKQAWIIKKTKLFYDSCS